MDSDHRRMVRFLKPAAEIEPMTIGKHVVGGACDPADHDLEENLGVVFASVSGHSGSSLELWRVCVQRDAGLQVRSLYPWGLQPLVDIL